MSSKKMPPVAVPFHQPLDEPMSVGEAKERVAFWMRELVEEGSLSFVAFAEGERLTADGKEEEVMFFLLYSHRDYCDRPMYIVFENWSDKFEDAVLIDGDPRNDGRLLPPEQALAQWVAGFMAKNEAVPGSHSLGYRLIEG